MESMRAVSSLTTNRLGSPTIRRGGTASLSTNGASG